MSKRPAKMVDDIDWSSLITAGSLIGNILQSVDKTQLERTLKLSKEQARLLVEQRSILQTQLEVLKKAYDSLKNKVKVLENINEAINCELYQKDKKITELGKQIEKQQKGK
jgi:hypothetical protein